MKPTMNDLRFLQARQVPRWALRLNGRPSVTLALHAAINARAGIRHATEPHNALVLLSMVRSRHEESLCDYMMGHVTGNHRLWYRRWLRKLVLTRSYQSRYANVPAVVANMHKGLATEVSR